MAEYPRLPRKPLGYDPAAVDRLISERDSMLGLAEHRIRQAESRLADLEELLKSRDELLGQLQADLEDRALVALERPAEEPPAEEEPPPLTPKFMTEELSKIVVAAEESTSQIIERAWAATRDQIVEADRLWREVQAEAVRFASWREEAEAIVEAVKGSIQSAKAKIEEVPQRVQEALAPAIDAMVEVDAGMSRFSKASTLPLLGAPSGLESARAEAHAQLQALGDEVDEPEQDDGPDVPGGLAPSEEASAPPELWAHESFLSVDDDDVEGLQASSGNGAESEPDASDSPDELEDDTIDPGAANIWRGSA